MDRVVCGYFLLLSVYYCVLVNGQKSGTCPPSTNIGGCAITCVQDSECAGDAKCCRTACGGSICARAMIPLPAQNNDREKPGSCPIHPSGQWVCSSRCSKDSNCRGVLKCCKNRCGALACTKPE